MKKGELIGNHTGKRLANAIKKPINLLALGYQVVDLQGKLLYLMHAHQVDDISSYFDKVDIVRDGVREGGTKP
jgi:hypothetical protein